MSLMAYLVLFLVAGYLFRVNPVLCVGFINAVVFFKVRGFFGGRNRSTFHFRIFVWGQLT